MPPIQFCPDAAVTAIYAGLTASGYDFADPGMEGPVAPIIRLIQQAHWPSDILAYFSVARTMTCAVNPYWPRAFLLVLAGLHMTAEEPFRFEDPKEMSAHVQRLDLIASDEKAPDVLDWLKRLPAAYASVRSHPAFPEIWHRIEDLVNAGLDQYARIAIGVESALAETFGLASGFLPPVIAIVNPLQAPQVDDYVHVQRTTYAITARPDAAPLMHEILHHVLGPLLKREEATIAEHHILLNPVLSDMLNLRYAWDEGPSSWLRVFEENFMRAASLFAAWADDPQSGRRTAERYACDGFIYAPVILQEFRSSWHGLDAFPEFLKRCLSACQHRADAHTGRHRNSL